jgi:hypothetical protein
VTALAFLAAAWAGRWAFLTWQVGAGTLAIERSTILGQRRCENATHESKPDLPLRIEQDFIIRDGAPEPTSGFDRTDYELISLGRSPIVNAIVDVRVDFKNAESDQHTVEVGSIRSDASVHCALWIHDDILSEIVAINWLSDGARCKGTLEFEPLPAHTPTIRRKKAYSPKKLPRQGPRGRPKLEGKLPSPPEGAKAPE